MEKTRHSLGTQGVQHIQLNVALVGAAAAAPTVQEGDVALATGTVTGLYLTSARTGVGAYSVTTVDPFLAIVGFQVQVAAATTTVPWSVTLGVPTQNANSTWTCTYQVFSTTGLTATDVATTGRIYVQITARNSVIRP